MPRRILLLSWVLLAGQPPAVHAQPSIQDEDLPLPRGLENSDEKPLQDGQEPGAGEPDVPPGLGAGEPDLPSGLGGAGEPRWPNTARATTGSAEKTSRSAISVKATGFLDRRLGARVLEDPTQERTSIDDTRVQLALDLAWRQRYSLRLVADAIYDPVLEDYGVDLERGRGIVDLREAVFFVPIVSFMDIKIGRQILTWGTADLLFLNDLFPKDWQAFSIGRDNAYLKAPSDAVRISLFSVWSNLDMVFVPRFDADRAITGERLSYYNPVLMDISGRNAIIDAQLPDEWLSDAEWHARLYRNLGSVELALYGYRGYWKSPAGFDAETLQPTHPGLAVYGASMRAPWLGGIGHSEVAYYQSLDDADGIDPLIANSELRAVAGYERSLPAIATDLTIGIQYYLEWLMSHQSYVDSYPAGWPVRDRIRHVSTLRITKLLWSQNLRISLFGYLGPSDLDGHLRTSVEYRVNDHATIQAGGNLFYGRKDHTFFGQFEKNSNVYASLRYGL